MRRSFEMREFVDGKLLPGEVSQQPYILTLAQAFPGAMEFLPQGETLYHQSNNLNGLMAAQQFDPSFSRNEGAFYFSSVQVPSRTNCAVKIREPLVFITRDDLLSRRDYFGMQVKGATVWDGASHLGIDGRTARVRDPFVALGHDRFSTEIVVFAPSVHKLGEIKTL